MNPFSLALEILVAVVMLVLVVFSWAIGRKEKLGHEKGWTLIFGGFCLLLFGALVDISDHFPSLSRFIILGQTPVQSLAEKVVGFLGGFLLLSIGFQLWVPSVVARRRSERELRRLRDKLEEEVKRGSAELSLKKLDLEREIHERRQAASALRRSEEIFETIVASAPIALFANDSDGRITLVRGSALPLLEVLPDKVMGQPVSEAFRHDPQLVRNFERALQGERLVSTVKVRRLVFQFRHSPWQNDRGEVVGVITVAMDVTERERVQREFRRAMEAAEEANRAKSQFLAKMSHELRTPLNSVIGFANILQKNKEASLHAKDLQYLDRIRQNGEHLLNLINEILDLSRIESGREELTLRRIDLPVLIEETVAQLRGEMTDDRVRLQAEIPGAITPVWADEMRLKQVLINLLSNALKFTDAGSVTIRLEADEHSLEPRRLDVVDTGIGIPLERLATIFDAFQQVDSSTSRKYGGTGLGLSISRSLCRLMGFDLEVASELGQGSTFSIVFPRALRDERIREDLTAADSEPRNPAATTLPAATPTAQREEASRRG